MFMVEVGAVLIVFLGTLQPTKAGMKVRTSFKVELTTNELCKRASEQQPRPCVFCKCVATDQCTIVRASCDWDVGRHIYEQQGCRARYSAEVRQCCPHVLCDRPGESAGASYSNSSSSSTSYSKNSTAADYGAVSSTIEWDNRVTSTTTTTEMATATRPTTATTTAAATTTMAQTTIAEERRAQTTTITEVAATTAGLTTTLRTTTTTTAAAAGPAIPTTTTTTASTSTGVAETTAEVDRSLVDTDTYHTEEVQSVTREELGFLVNGGVNEFKLDRNALEDARGDAFDQYGSGGSDEVVTSQYVFGAVEGSSMAISGGVQQDEEEFYTNEVRDSIDMDEVTQTFGDSEKFDRIRDVEDESRESESLHSLISELMAAVQDQNITLNYNSEGTVAKMAPATISEEDSSNKESLISLNNAIQSDYVTNDPTSTIINTPIEVVENSTEQNIISSEPVLVAAEDFTEISINFPPSDHFNDIDKIPGQSGEASEDETPDENIYMIVGGRAAPYTSQQNYSRQEQTKQSTDNP